jgi:ketosteroid isomerase-like protein
MSKRLSAFFVSCIGLCLVPQMSHGQETDDTRAIRALLTADQEAWKIGDSKQVLSHMDEHYTVFSAPTVNGELDFNGIEVAATPGDFREHLLDPEWKGHPGEEALADTTLDFQTSHELSRIDVKGDYAVAISRIVWAINDTTAAEPTRESGGWESVWFLRKVDGVWKYTGAVGDTKRWED